MPQTSSVPVSSARAVVARPVIVRAEATRPAPPVPSAAFPRRALRTHLEVAGYGVELDGARALLVRTPEALVRLRMDRRHRWLHFERRIRLPAGKTAAARCAMVAALNEVSDAICFHAPSDDVLVADFVLPCDVGVMCDQVLEVLIDFCRLTTDALQPYLSAGTAAAPGAPQA